MVRNDGDYTIYILEYWGNIGRKDEWLYAGDGDQFTKGEDHFKEPFRSFGACGECWQETGIHGTYDKQTAFELLVKVAAHTPNRVFRIAELKISQTTTGICEINVQNKGKRK